MKLATEFTPQDYTELVLPSEYDDLVRRRSSLKNREYRLLWAVLEGAIRTYRATSKCLNRIQRQTFQEVC
jgi:hypothetical protein